MRRASYLPCMSKHLVRLGLIQMRCSAEPRENLEKALARVAEAADRGAQIICLQELFTSQYFCQVEDHKYFALAEEIPGPSTESLAKLAKELSSASAHVWLGRVRRA